MPGREPIPVPPDLHDAPRRPDNPLGLDLLIDADTRLPEVEGSGCFETLSDRSRSWSIGRPADCSALVDEIAPLADGGYLVTLRPATTDDFDLYPYVLSVDGTVENLDPIETSGQTIDVHPGPDGLTVLTVNDGTATIETSPR